LELIFWGMAGGAGGTWKPGRLVGASRGGFRVTPAFLILIFAFDFWVVEWSGGVPDLAVLLFEAVRSGTS
jgi:hypothetical protein